MGLFSFVTKRPVYDYRAINIAGDLLESGEVSAGTPLGARTQVIRLLKYDKWMKTATIELTNKETKEIHHYPA